MPFVHPDLCHLFAWTFSCGFGCGISSYLAFRILGDPNQSEGAPNSNENWI